MLNDPPYHPFDPFHYAQLDRIERKLDWLINKENIMSAELDALTAEVAQDTSVESSAVTLINGLAAQLAAAGTDPAKLSALTASLTTSSSALAAAVAANTSAAPTPTT